MTLGTGLVISTIAICITVLITIKMTNDENIRSEKERNKK